MTTTTTHYQQEESFNTNLTLTETVVSPVQPTQVRSRAKRVNIEINNPMEEILPTKESRPTEEFEPAQDHMSAENDVFCGAFSPLSVNLNVATDQQSQTTDMFEPGFFDFFEHDTSNTFDNLDMSRQNVTIQREHEDLTRMLLDIPMNDPKTMIQEWINSLIESGKLIPLMKSRLATVTVQKEGNLLDHLIPRHGVEFKVQEWLSANMIKWHQSKNDCLGDICLHHYLHHNGYDIERTSPELKTIVRVVIKDMAELLYHYNRSIVGGKYQIFKDSTLYFIAQ